ncbi:hypothetical protein [Arthrobacter sp. MA-N2]|uniref:hypothetical protein n=1 Tax=Arthrobacter sp. MA-N2 TaxID=1101188 RepID=UPI0004811842|nr:hypothetical protein [Arthrobacter sp. MA-N2]
MSLWAASAPAQLSGTEARGILPDSTRLPDRRHKLFEQDRINERHPAARYRGAFGGVTVNNTDD